MSASSNAPSTDLPIQQILPKVCGLLSSHNNLIISADPGTGKSTLLPLALLHEPWLKNKKILLLEPNDWPLHL